MSDPTSGGFDFGGLLEQAQQMQQGLLAAQAAAASEIYEGSSGGGAVRITSNGLLEFQSVSVSPSVVDPDDPDLLADLVLAALRDLTSRVTAAVGEASGPDLSDLSGLGDMMSGLLGGNGLLEEDGTDDTDDPA